MIDGEIFSEALWLDFEKHDVAVIERLREENPLEYLELCASLIVPDIRVTLADKAEAGELH